MKKKKAKMRRINPFKLFYYRRKAQLSRSDVAAQTGINQIELERLEHGTVAGKPQRHSDFAQLDDLKLRKLEEVLNCPGKLTAGKDDDFATQFVHYYEVNMPSEGEATAGQIADHPETWRPKAVVFDFDGTLTAPGVNRTTWERLWTQLGYTVNECGMLAQQFFRKEIDHEHWCQLTLEKFKAKRLRRDAVRAVGSSIKLIDGFESTIERIHREQIPMYIVSGSIWDVVSAAIGKHASYFKRIEANVFTYTPEDVIANIIGTRYDFEGKAEFVKIAARNLKISTSEILFIGNSINDEKVKAISGARTLLVNPHFTAPSKEWDHYIPEMDNLEQILPYLGLASSPSDGQSVSVNSRDDTVAILQNKDELDLSSFTVVGGYRRFNAHVRAQLQNLCQQITGTFWERPLGRENYLICAAPGSGKTYFIQEVARSLGDRIRFIEIDLSKDNEATVRAKLDQVGGDSDCLCMIDEIDGKAHEQWPYDVIYKKLDVNEDPHRGAAAVFALIGSSGGNITGLKDAIKSRYKAKDLIDRIPDNPKYCVQIPAMEVGDGICVYISKILEAAARRNEPITHVEKFAIFYAANTALSSPRQIKMLADHAVARVKRGNSILTFDHHFDPGQEESKQFWTKYRDVAELLHGQIKIA